MSPVMFLTLNNLDDCGVKTGVGRAMLSGVCVKLLETTTMARLTRTLFAYRMTLSAVLLCMGIFCGNVVLAAGVWDDNVVLVGVNPNGNSVNADEVRIKKTSGGNSGCTVVKFRPGFGSLPLDSNGIAARDRIYATALAAFLADKPVSIWVWDTANCYGLMLVFTNSSGF